MEETIAGTSDVTSPVTAAGQIPQQRGDSLLDAAVRYAEEEGLIVRSLLGDVLSICPPLIIAPAEIDELFDRLERALDRTLAWVKHERLIDG